MTQVVDMVTGDISYPYARQMRNEKNKDEIRSCDAKGYMYEERESNNNMNGFAEPDSEREALNQIIIVAILILILLI
jgi:hypothetical protein